jgi:predicted transcriptional regulator of viral defense system
MKYKNITALSSKILTEMNEQGKAWFSLSEAYSMFPDLPAGNLRVQIKRMVDGGLLLRVCEGVYYVIPFEQVSDNYMPDWHLLAEPLTGGRHYVGYYSALQIHGLVTQPSLKEQIVVDRQHKPSENEIRGVKFQFIFHNKKRFFGYGEQWISSFDKVMCSDVEKTIIDCLRKPEYAGGIPEIAKALFTAREQMDYALLLEYATKFGSQAVIKRLGYLLELMGIDTLITEKLMAMRSSSVSLLDTEAPRSGKTLTRWNIVQNIEANTIRRAVVT